MFVGYVTPTADTEIEPGMQFEAKSPDGHSRVVTVKEVSEEERKNFSLCLLLGTAFGATIGGVAMTGLSCTTDADGRDVLTGTVEGGVRGGRNEHDRARRHPAEGVRPPAAAQWHPVALDATARRFQ